MLQSSGKKKSKEIIKYVNHISQVIDEFRKQKNIPIEWQKAFFDAVSRNITKYIEITKKSQPVQRTRKQNILRFVRSKTFITGAVITAVVVASLSSILSIGAMVALGVVLLLGVVSIPLRKISIENEALAEFASLKQKQSKIIDELTKLNKPGELKDKTDSFHYFNLKRPDFLGLFSQDSVQQKK